jgi:ribosomal protein S27E
MPVICLNCGKDMQKANSCLKFIVVDNSQKEYDPIPYGQETPIEQFFLNHHVKCGDCGVKFGGYHHPGCDMEECPICHKQLISCYCHEEGE